MKEKKNFLVKIRQQAAMCSFGVTAQEATDISIKNKIIDDWAPIDLKRKLTSLSEVIDLCQIHEQTATQSNTMNLTVAESGPSTSSVNKVCIRNQDTKERCSRCNRAGHTSNSTFCSARNSKCHKCELQGHFARFVENHHQISVETRQFQMQESSNDPESIS